MYKGPLRYKGSFSICSKASWYRIVSIFVLKHLKAILYLKNYSSNVHFILEFICLLSIIQFMHFAWTKFLLNKAVSPWAQNMSQTLHCNTIFNFTTNKPKRIICLELRIFFSGTQHCHDIIGISHYFL